MKELNFAVTPRQIPLVELITGTESAVWNNNIMEAEAKQLRVKVLASLSNQSPIQKYRLQRDQDNAYKNRLFQTVSRVQNYWPDHMLHIIPKVSYT